VTITNGYCTQAQVKNAVGIEDAVDDTLIDAAINAASRQIDAHCGRRFWQDSTVKTREFYADCSSEVFVGDISTTTGLLVDLDEADTGAFGTSLTISTHFVLLPLNAADETPVWPYTHIRLVDGAYTFPMSSSGRPGLRVTAKFGWPAVPDDVTQACILQARTLFKAPATQFGAFQVGVDGFSRQIRPIDPVAGALLAPYVRVEA
jgi:hypothetical protein